MKRDAYKTDERWSSYKRINVDYIVGVRKEDHKLLMEFLTDMELGLNTPKGMNGKRSSGTLLNLASHNTFFLKNFKKPLLKITKLDLHKLESDVEKGKILKQNGKPFSQFGNYIKDFKVFYHWLERTKKVSSDITEDISAKTTKPSWVYLTEEQVKNFFNKLSFDMRTICWFFYDSGARVTEANSLRIQDFSEDFKQVSIPDEVSKTFGRTINLKLSSELLKEYIKQHNLKPEDYLFKKSVFAMNKYLRYWCGKTFGQDKISNSKAKGKYGTFTMYDIRHNSSCYWLNRYPTHKGLMYRFGWRKADKIEYYSEMLGVQDELTDNNMVIGEDKNKIYQMEETIEKLKEDNKRIIADSFVSNAYMKLSMDLEMKKITPIQFKRQVETLSKIAKDHKVIIKKEYLTLPE